MSMRLNRHCPRTLKAGVDGLLGDLEQPSAELILQNFVRVLLGSDTLDKLRFKCRKDFCRVLSVVLPTFLWRIAPR